MLANDYILIVPYGTMATKDYVEKRGSKYYLYRVTPYWDKEKKQGRKKKEYLGPCDESGNMIESRRRALPQVPYERPYRSVTVGPYDFLLKLSDKIELRKRLTDVFGNKKGNQILSMGIMRITDHDSLRLIEDTVETTPFPMLLGDMDYSSQRLSEELEDLGKNDSGRGQFYESCIQEDDTAVFDTSVLQSSSKLMDMLENGRKTSKTGLPQVNLGLVHSLRTCLPVMMRLFPGSISDVSTVKNLIGRLRSMGSKHVSLVMDRGFYSESNIAFLESQADCDYLIPLKGGTDLYKECITAANDDLENPVNMFHFHGCTEYYSDRKIDWPYETRAFGPDGTEVKKLRILVFLNTVRANEEKDTFSERIFEVESAASETEWKDEPTAISEIFKGRLEGMEKLFDISRKDDGKVALTRRRNALTFAMRNFGKVVFLTNMESPPEEILELYRKRDEDEKAFEMLKDDMDGGIQYVHSIESAKGMLFIQFIGLSIRMYMRRTMDDDMKKLGIPMILKRLRSLTATELRTGWVINEIPKKCRDIYKHFGLDLPTAESLTGHP